MWPTAVIAALSYTHLSDVEQLVLRSSPGFGGEDFYWIRFYGDPVGEHLQQKLSNCPAKTLLNSVQPVRSHSHTMYF